MKFLLLLALTIAAPAPFAAGREQWIELRSPNFLIVTNAGEKQARHVAHQFESIRAVFQDYFGLSNSSAATLPITIIAARDEGSFKALVPEFWAKRGSMHPAGLYLGGSDPNYVVLRLDISLNQNADEPYEPIYHEYVHYLLRRQQSQFPLWMVEGLAEMYGNTRIESKKVYLGAPSTTNLAILL